MDRIDAFMKEKYAAEYTVQIQPHMWLYQNQDLRTRFIVHEMDRATVVYGYIDTVPQETGK